MLENCSELELEWNCYSIVHQCDAGRGPGNIADPDIWSQSHDEGAQILWNLANIPWCRTRSSLFVQRTMRIVITFG